MTSSTHKRYCHGCESWFERLDQHHTKKPLCLRQHLSRESQLSQLRKSQNTPTQCIAVGGDSPAGYSSASLSNLFSSPLSSVFSPTSTSSNALQETSGNDASPDPGFEDHSNFPTFWGGEENDMGMCDTSGNEVDTESYYENLFPEEEADLANAAVPERSVIETILESYNSPFLPHSCPETDASTVSSAASTATDGEDLDWTFFTGRKDDQDGITQSTPQRHHGSCTPNDNGNGVYRNFTPQQNNQETTLNDKELLPTPSPLHQDHVSSEHTYNHTTNDEFLDDNDPSKQLQYSTEFVDHVKRLREKGYVDKPWSAETAHMVRLLEICGDANIPIGVFDKITRWAEGAHRDGVFQTGKKLPRRAKFLEALSQYVGTDNLKPREEPVTLKKANVDVMVTHIDAYEAVISLLTDSDLMKHENLNFYDEEHSHDIFSEPKFDAEMIQDMDDHILEDVFSGTEVRKAYEYRVKCKGSELVIPIIFFIDKTHTDHHGKLTQEPICITLGIFNKKTRTQPYAWRVVGYIPNSSMYPGAKDSGGKAQDYHAIMAHIFQRSRLDRLTHHRHLWEFQPGIDKSNRSRRGLLSFNVGFLTGDTEGNDKASGHFNCRTANVKRLCRKCDTLFSDTGNPWVEFEYLSRKQMAHPDLCREFSYHHLEDGNAFDLLNFGIPRSDETCHIAHYATNDYMHVKRLGLLGYLINGFRNLQRLGKSLLAAASKKSRNEEEEGKLDDDIRNVQLTEGIDSPHFVTGGTQDAAPENESENMVIASGKVKGKKGASKDGKGKKKDSKQYIFTKSIKYVAEKALLIWGTLISMQSVRGFPRTYFPQGALSTAKLNAHEYPGVLLLYLVLVCSTLGQVWLEEKPKEEAAKNYNCKGWLGNNAVYDWVKTIELCILQDAFIRRDNIDRGTLEKYKEHMPIFLETYRKTLDRQEGNGTNFIKFHANLHDADDVMRFGPISGFDTGVGETNHKEISKKTAKRTQKRAKLLDFQSAVRYCENITIFLATARLSANFYSRTKNSKDNQEKVSRANDNQGIDESSKNEMVIWGTHSFRFKEGGFLMSPVTKKERAKEVPCEWHDTGLQDRVSTFIERNIASKLNSDEIEMPTNIRVSGVLYRAHPARRATRNYKTGWNDWAYVDWGEIPVIQPNDHQAPKPTKSRKAAGKREVPTKDLGGQDYLDENDGVAIVHLLCFLTLKDLPQHGLKVMGRKVTTGGIYAVCHAVTQQAPDAACHNISTMVKWVTKDTASTDYSNTTLKLYLINTDDIVGPCACVPDLWPEKKRGTRDLNPFSKEVKLQKAQFLLIESPERWPSLYLEHIEEDLKNWVPLDEVNQQQQYHDTKSSSTGDNVRDSSRKSGKRRGTGKRKR